MFLKACFGSMILSALFVFTSAMSFLLCRRILKIMLLGLYSLSFCICRLEKPFDKDVIRILLCCIQVVKMYAISLDICTALMDHLYFDLLLPHL